MKSLTERRWASVATGAALFAAIFLARATVGTLGDAISFLYVVPVVLIATSCGTRAGLLAGTVAFVLASLGGLFMDLTTTPLGYVNRAVVFLFIGGLTGRFATTMRDLEAESARHFDLSLDMISMSASTVASSASTRLLSGPWATGPRSWSDAPSSTLSIPATARGPNGRRPRSRTEPRPCCSRIATSPRTVRCTGWSGPPYRCWRRA